MKRASGVLMHISSLSSPYGIGSMGKEAREFVDFLKKSGQSYWQILPVCPTSYGDSPYQSFSTFAGNPYFIDYDILKEQGILFDEDYKFEWGKAVILNEGTDVTICATGLMVSEAIEAQKILAEQGISAEIINVHTIKPLDKKL